MTENDTLGNSKKAWLYLKSLRDDSGYINIVAIDPHSGDLTAITSEVSARSVFEFIERNNGKRNIYYMVNTPFASAPDTKLKKGHVEFINAVWLDADPRPLRAGSPKKDQHFEQERIRLLEFADSLKASKNPPTYIIDSGNGIQALWVLNKPVVATPESVTLYEAYSRSLADTHGTDRVQNIDRIMRLPFTYNIPTKKKKDCAMRLSRIIHATSKRGVRYD